MKRIVLTFGLLSGAISSFMIVASLPFTSQIEKSGYIVGYTTLVLAFLLVYFGIRAYRDHYCAGRITFAQALLVGTLITVVSSLCYVVTWEIAFFTFDHAFIDQYTARAIAQAKASGAGGAALQAQLHQISQFKKLYDNPLYNAAITFIEPFPVGMVIAIVSAFALSRSRSANLNQSASSA